MDTIYFHEHEEIAGELKFRTTVMMDRYTDGRYVCEILIAVRDTNKMPSIYSTKITAMGGGYTPKKAYNDAYHYLRNHNNLMVTITGYTYL